MDWATDPVSRTVSLKKLASLLVKLRSTHERNNMPDWAGRSFDYRAQVSKIMGSAGLSDKDRKKVVGLLRYHVGNELREQVSATDLERCGLQVDSPKQRVLNAKGSYRTVDAAVQTLAEAVEAIKVAPYEEIEESHLEAMGEVAFTLSEIADLHDEFGR